MLLFDRCLNHLNRGGVGGSRTLIHDSHSSKALFLFEVPVSHYIKTWFDNRSLLDRSIQQKPKSKKRQSRSPLGNTRQLNPRIKLNQSHLGTCTYSFGIKALKPGCGSAEYRPRIELVVHQTTSSLFCQYKFTLPVKAVTCPFKDSRVGCPCPFHMFCSFQSSTSSAEPPIAAMA